MSEPEVIEEQMPEILHAEPTTLVDLMDFKSLNVPGMRLYKISPQNFYGELAKLYRNGQTDKLAGSTATCVGGSFRSSRINDEL